MPQDQGDDLGNTKDQSNVEEASKHDWFKKPKRPPTPDPFNLIKGTYKSRVELEFHFKEYYKAVTDKLDCEGHEYPFSLSKPLPLIEDQGRQDVKYGTIEAIEDMVPLLWSLVEKKIRELTILKENFPRLNLCDIEDMLLLLVQKKLSNLERDNLFYLNVALRMFTRRVVILKRVEDLQLGVKSYQKQLNITRPETFRSDITKMTPYTAYNNPQGIIYQEKFQRNKLMRFDELYKFCDGTFSSVQRVLHGAKT
ncbi:hypothetical protein Tco_0935887 [Tanacetum coccineum]